MLSELLQEYVNENQKKQSFFNYFNTDTLTTLYDILFKVIMKDLHITGKTYCRCIPPCGYAKMYRKN